MVDKAARALNDLTDRSAHTIKSEVLDELRSERL
jgi:hypothetical protein